MPTYEYIGYAELYGGANWSTRANSFDTTFSDFSIFSRDTRHGRFNLAADTLEAWFHFTIYKEDIGGASASDNVLDCRDDNGTTLFALANNNSTNNDAAHPVLYRDGGALVDAGDFTMNADQRYMLDIHINNTGGGAGEFEFYVDGVLLYNAAATTGTGVFINNFRMWNNQHDLNSFRTDYYYSEFLVGVDALSPTLNRRVWSRFPTGDSLVNVAWTGGFDDVNDTTAINDGNLLRTSTGGLRQGLTFPAVPAVTADVEAVGIMSRAFIGDGSPRDYGHTVRTSGVDYDQAAHTAGPLLETHTTVLELNPASSNPWTVGEINISEFGYVSI